MIHLFSEKDKIHLTVAEKSEPELNEYITKNWNNLFQHLTFIKSEFLLKGEVTATDGSGKVDILAFNSQTKKFVVFELKKNKNRYIKDQASHYREFIEENLADIYIDATEICKVNLPAYNKIKKASENIEVEMVLIAKAFSTNDLKILKNKKSNITLIRYEWFMKGKENYFLYEYLNNTPETEKIEKPERGINKQKRKKKNEVEFDTIVVPAQEDGFQDVFLCKDAWWEIRINAKNIDKIKYIAVYRAAPVSAITHWAVVENIKKYKNTKKYIVKFKGKAKKIRPIKLVSTKKGRAPQAPRYTTYKKLRAAKNFKDVFNEKTESTGKSNVVEDQILPVIVLIKNGKSIAEACSTIANNLGIKVQSVRAKFYGKPYLYLSAKEVMDIINSGRIKDVLIKRYPDKRRLIIEELGN